MAYINQTFLSITIHNLGKADLQVHWVQTTGGGGEVGVAELSGKQLLN